jgi:putative NADH-flavin reductase
MVKGVTEGYQRGLELYGTGYSANVQGRRLVIQCGLAHAIERTIPAGVDVVVEASNTRGNDTPAKFVSGKALADMMLADRSLLYVGGAGSDEFRFLLDGKEYTGATGGYRLKDYKLSRLPVPKASPGIEPGLTWRLPS